MPKQATAFKVALLLHRVVEGLDATTIAAQVASLPGGPDRLREIVADATTLLAEVDLIEHDRLEHAQGHGCPRGW